MAIVLDERAKGAIAHRRAQGHDSRVLLHIERLHGRAGAMAGYPEVLTVGWIPHRWPPCILVGRSVGEVTVILDTRVERYIQEHDLTISAWHLGHIDRRTIDPQATQEMHEWERAHPDDRHNSPATVHACGR